MPVTISGDTINFSFADIFTGSTNENVKYGVDKETIVVFSMDDANSTKDKEIKYIDINFEYIKENIYYIDSKCKNLK